MVPVISSVIAVSVCVVKDPVGRSGSRLKLKEESTCKEGAKNGKENDLSVPKAQENYWTLSK